MKKHRHSVIMPGLLSVGMMIGICWCTVPQTKYSPADIVKAEASIFHNGIAFLQSRVSLFEEKIEHTIRPDTDGSHAAYATPVVILDTAETTEPVSVIEESETSANPVYEEASSEGTTVQTVPESTVAEKVPQETERTDEISDSLNMYRTTTGLYIRSTPSSQTGDNIVGEIPEGASVTSAGEISADGRWIAVIYQGQHGWAYRKYMIASDGNPEESSP